MGVSVVIYDNVVNLQRNKANIIFFVLLIIMLFKGKFVL